MADYLAVMAAHVRSVQNRTGSEAKAGATLLQARAHLEEKAWRTWVERDVKIDITRARDLMDAAEKQGASIESLRPSEI